MKMPFTVPRIPAVVPGRTGLLCAFVIILGLGRSFAGNGTATVKVRNPIAVARMSETISLKVAGLKRLLAVDDLRRVHVQDQLTKQELLTQAIDEDQDGSFDELIFQTDLAPQQTKTFLLTVGDRQVPRREDFKAYGRFVRERRDDFAWENDRIAHRMYGAALETWAQEPLTSSAVDVWSKRVPRLVINDWYMVDDYHRDNGTGGDFYSAGKSRGCGGNGLWVNDKLYPSANFRDSRVLANGPIRVMFELTYQPWDAAGMKVSEVKRITLDAGQNLDRFESYYKMENRPATGTVAHAVGIKKAAGAVSTTNRERGTLRTWEPVKGATGFLGCGVIVAPSDVTAFTEGDGNYLVVTTVPQNGPVAYYTGFAWDQAGQVANVGEWDQYLERFARRLASPVKVTLAAASK